MRTILRGSGLSVSEQELSGSSIGTQEVLLSKEDAPPTFQLQASLDALKLYEQEATTVVVPIDFDAWG